MKLYILLAICHLLVFARSQCSNENCIGDCGCFSTNSINDLGARDTPQLVMLTFDDAVNVVNYPTFEQLLMTGRINKGNGCPIKATFYVSHEYTNYHCVHQLYRYGSEVAVHSISHASTSEYWRQSSDGLWKEEIVGMRTILSNLARIPLKEIKGNRAPFLQTGGNPTFRVLHENGFTYDSSMPSRVFTDPPMWPYSLDYGFKQDCSIHPCPNELFDGLWEVPLVSWHLDPFHCSMVDACTVVPETEENILEFMKKNFLRHYESNRAPFPVFLHEAWFHLPQRKRAYFKFVDWMLQKDDVFLVTVNDVIDYVKNPVSLNDYRGKTCDQLPLENKCDTPRMCRYDGVLHGGSRFMVSCGQCPNSYPWMGNPSGL